MRWRFGIPILLGAVIAIPLSVSAVPKWMSPLAQRLGLMRIPIYPNVWLVVLALVGIFVCGFISTSVCLRTERKRV